VVIIDQAGCPLINNSTYNSTAFPGYSFLQECGQDILPSGTPSINFMSSVQSSFNDCLDACASYNQKAKSVGCLGATWVMFSADHPDQNSMCFLKNATGISTAAAKGESLVSGLLHGVTPV